MSKTAYLFITLILGINFWNLIILEPFFNGVTNPVFAVLWALMGLYWFRNRPGHEKVYDFRKYRIYFFWLIVGFSLSVVSAKVFWNQDVITGIIVNRYLIWYLYIPLFLYIQPSEPEIVKAISYYSVVYFILWLIQAATPYPLFTTIAEAVESGRGTFALAETDFGQLFPGYSVILILLYYKTQKFIENPTFKSSILVFGLLAFFFLLQNRGALFFAVIVFAYALFKLRIYYKILLFPVLGILIAIIYFYSAQHWNALFQETIDQLNDPNTNRWRSFYLFLFDYSPHWLCNILGNGLLSAHVPSGKVIQDLMDQGYYQYDNGLLGFWSQYGVIPLLVLYTVIFALLFRSRFPFYIKAIAAHILFIPIAWNFGTADILIFVLLIYLYAYYREQSKSEELINLPIQEAG